MREIKRIFVHCLATKPSMDVGVETVREWHKQRGMSDAGYHGIIRRDGSFEQGRPDEVVGAHVRGHNHDSLGVALEGGMAEDGTPVFNFTFKQMDALRYYLHRKCGEYGLSLDDVHGHCDVDSGKTCPNFDVKSLLSQGT